MTAAVSISLDGRHNEGRIVLSTEAVTRHVVIQVDTAAPSVSNIMKDVDVADWMMFHSPEILHEEESSESEREGVQQEKRKEEKRPVVVSRLFIFARYFKTHRRPLRSYPSSTPCQFAQIVRLFLKEKHLPLLVSKAC